MTIEEMETDNIYIGAFFLLSGCTLLRKRREGRKVIFIFMNNAGSMKDLKDAYYLGSHPVKPHDYAQKIMAMKEMLAD